MNPSLDRVESLGEAEFVGVVSGIGLTNGRGWQTGPRVGPVAMGMASEHGHDQ